MCQLAGFSFPPTHRTSGPTRTFGLSVPHPFPCRTVPQDLKYGALPEVDEQIKRLRAAGSSDAMLTEEVGPEEIAVVVSRWTGIPVSRLKQSEREKLLELKQQLQQRVVGQEEAVAAVADAVLRSRAGLAARQRGSSFLFLGPTGVGKTELAKALAQLLFDDEKMMVGVG